MKRTTAHVQQQLPLTVHETRQARMARLLSGEVGKLIKPASAFSFNAAAAKRAQAIARGEAPGGASRGRAASS